MYETIKLLEVNNRISLLAMGRHSLTRTQIPEVIKEKNGSISLTKIKTYVWENDKQ